MPHVLRMRFGNVDLSAKLELESVESNDQMEWSDLGGFGFDDGVPPKVKFATNEPNYTLMDGTAEEWPDDPYEFDDWGLFSNSMSGEDGYFQECPTLDICFSGPRRTSGVTFFFYPHYRDEYVEVVDITWYRDAEWETVRKEGRYVIHGLDGIVEEGVDNFQSVRIKFVKTRHPYRYLKLWMIEWGIVRDIEDEEISVCKILEEVDPTSRSISINVMNAQIRTLNSLFSPITSPRFYGMMENQYLTVYRDGEAFGTFFLKKWKDKTQDGIVFDLTAYDAMSILDMYRFMGGIYENCPVREILDEIFGIAFPTRLIGYLIDEEFENASVTGYIPICSCGQALQHIAFALNATIDTARQNFVWIYPREWGYIKYQIPLERQYRGGSDEPAKYVTQVEVTSYTYTAVEDEKDEFKGVLPLGVQVVEFREPLQSESLEVSEGASIVERHNNYVVLNVETVDEIVISGKQYLNSMFVHRVRLPSIAGRIDVIEEYKDYTLVCRDIGTELATKLLAFYVNQVQTRGELILGNLEVGYVARVKTRYRDVIGVLSSLDLNLRADRAKFEVLGVAVDTGLSWYYVDELKVIWDVVDGKEMTWDEIAVMEEREE